MSHCCLDEPTRSLHKPSRPKPNLSRYILGSLSHAAYTTGEDALKTKLICQPYHHAEQIATTTEKHNLLACSRNKLLENDVMDPAWTDLNSTITIVVAKHWY